MKEWGVVALAAILSSPILMAVSLIVVAVIFIASYVTLAVYGLVSAVIYGLTALGFVWLIGSFSRQSLEKHWWISLMIPGFFVFGLISDRVSSLSLSVLPNAIGQNIVIAQQNVMDGNAVTVYGPYAVSVIALVIAVIALVMSIKIKKKYWWTKIR